MEFCPRCESVLIAEKKSNSVVLICRKCGYVKKPAGDIVAHKQRKTKKTVMVDDMEKEVLPKTGDVQCPQCGNKEAYWWSVQTRSADEPMTQFFRCTKCGYTWREYA
ncbi:MAG: transcription factor S [Aigarchaeota archaeon]|nr:transcription factor S [Candidatus Calditenuaceae archaeon]